MGAYLAYLPEPVTEKVSEDAATGRLTYGASSMQGWRVSQEDSHNCISSYDENASFFAVYDGHGGAEVAQYCSMQLPDFIKSSKHYKSGNIAQALEDAFLDFDASLIKDDVLQQLKQMSGISSDTEDSENEVNFLHEEAHMPLEELLARYHKSSIEKQSHNAKNDSKFQSPFLKAKQQARCDEDNKAGPSCSFTSSDEKTSKEEEKSPEHENSTNHSSAKDSSEASDSLAHGDSSAAAEVNGSADDVAVEDKNNVENMPLGDSTNKVPNEKPAHEINGEVTGDASESIDASSTPDKGKGKGKGKGKTILGFAVADFSVKKEDKTTTVKKQATRIGHHRQAKPVNMEDNSGDSHDSESDDEYKCAPEIGVAEEENDVDSGNEEEEETSPENEVLEDNDSENESSSDDDDDDDDDDENDADDKDDEEFSVADKEEAGYDSGCTAVVALLRGDELYVANAGDSRCIVCRNGKAIEMSHDHKPEDEVEMKRIVAAGGKVTADGRVNGGLNLSRAIGDHSYKKNENVSLRDQMISALPDIRTLTIDGEEDEFMVIACDGIWNFMSSQQVVDFVRERLTPDCTKLSVICEELFDKCLAPTTLGDGTGCDNMTCIIVKFHHNTQDEKKECKRHIDSLNEDSSHKRLRTQTTADTESSDPSQ